MLCPLIPPYKIHKEKLLEICNKSKSFFHKTETLDGHKFDIFSYLVAEPNDFIEFAPYSFELRGLTIVDDNIVIPSIHKFFNHKENDLVMELPKGNLEIREKIDGSLITPVVVGHKIYFKSKKSFFSKEARIATEFVERHHNYKKFIYEMYYERGLIPYFELYSKESRVILDYGDTNLFLIQLRSMYTGSYTTYTITRNLGSYFHIPVVNKYDISIEELEKKVYSDTNIEGWVVQVDRPEYYTDFRKFKTLWYFNMSSIKESADRENYIIQSILDDKIDDVLSVLEDLDKEKKKYIEGIIHKLTSYIRKHVDYIKEQVTSLLPEINNGLDVKDVVMKYKDSYEYFPILMTCLRNGIVDEDRIYTLLKDSIKKKTSKYTDALKFLEEIG